MPLPWLGDVVSQRGVHLVPVLFEPILFPFLVVIKFVHLPFAVCVKRLGWKLNRQKQHEKDSEGMFIHDSYLNIGTFLKDILSPDNGVP